MRCIIPRWGKVKVNVDLYSALLCRDHNSKALRDWQTAREPYSVRRRIFAYWTCTANVDGLLRHVDDYIWAEDVLTLYKMFLGKSEGFRIWDWKKRFFHGPHPLSPSFLPPLSFLRPIGIWKRPKLPSGSRLSWPQNAFWWTLYAKLCIRWPCV